MREYGYVYIYIYTPERGGDESQLRVGSGNDVASKRK